VLLLLRRGIAAEDGRCAVIRGGLLAANMRLRGGVLVSDSLVNAAKAVKAAVRARQRRKRRRR